MIDISIFQYINGFAFRNLCLDETAIFLAKYLPYILVGILLVFLLKNYKKYFPLVATSALSAGLAYFLARILRLFCLRGRPFVEESVNLLLPHAASSSFPSLHASFFFALATGVFFYHKKWGLVFLVSAALISLSRVFVGIHWPSDILVGMALGILCAFLVKKILHYE